MNKQFFLSIGLLISLFSLPNFGHAQESGASLEFVPYINQANSGQEFTVDIILKNPSLQNIISVRTWLEYDPDLLEGLKIDTEGTPFSLSAPGENEFSPKEGWVKIGRSNISGGFNEAQTKVATVHFKVKSTAKQTANLSSYDYQTSELGHTSINIIDEGFPVNILSTKPKSTAIMLNGAASESVQETQNPSLGQNTMDSSRPLNLKVATGSGYADLKWDSSNLSILKGYNIYYGKTSGEYTRRRSVENLNQYRLEGLNNGETYYFAVTAYDLQNKETDYSDEVAIIINEPLSSTAPFEVLASSALDSVPSQPQNGPLIWWLGFSALGLGGVLVFRKKITN